MPGLPLSPETAARTPEYARRVPLIFTGHQEALIGGCRIKAEIVAMGRHSNPKNHHKRIRPRFFPPTIAGTIDSRQAAAAYNEFSERNAPSMKTLVEKGRLF